MSGRLLVKKRGAGASAPETSQERAVNRRKARRRTGLANYWMGLSDQCHLGYRCPTEPPSERNTGERERERHALQSTALVNWRISPVCLPFCFLRRSLPSFSFLSLIFPFFSLLNRRHLYILCERGTCAVPTLRSFVDTDVS